MAIENANLKLISQMIDEATAPTRMSAEAAREFLMLLRFEIITRLDALQGQFPALIRQGGPTGPENDGDAYYYQPASSEGHPSDGSEEQNDD